MKPQDVIFFIVVVSVLVSKKSKLFVVLGIISLFTAIPLFAKWIFFTAERLTWYAAGFFFLAIVMQIIEGKRKSS